MHVFQIKGFSGLAMFLLALIVLFAVFVLLPTAFMMVLWNALVFEGLRGPEIGMGQAIYLWLATAILMKIIFNPQISFQFKRMVDPADLGKLPDLKNKKSTKE